MTMDDPIEYRQVTEMMIYSGLSYFLQGAKIEQVLELPEYTQVFSEF